MVQRVDHRRQFPRAAHRRPVPQMPWRPRLRHACTGHRSPVRRARSHGCIRDRESDESNGGSRSWMSAWSRRTRRVSTAFIASRDARGVSRAGKHRPALCDRIDLTFGIGPRTQRRSVVEVCAAIPVAVPGVLFDPLPQLRRLGLASVRERRIGTQARHLGEFSENMAKEERQPDAFALAVPADKIHAVVPVPGPNQRQSMHAESETVQNSPHAVLIDGGALVGTDG